MPQNERLRVWRGELKKTSGGLTKAMLMKNKRGKIVSKRKSEAAKKNANNLGDWLRSKGDHFLSKGLKKENIVRKGKAGRKAFKKQEVPEEKQAEVPKKKKVQPKKAPAPKKKVQPVPKKKKAPPKITKLAPVGPGQKPKDKTNISAGNIIVQRKSKRKTKPKTSALENYIRRAKEAKYIFEDTLQEVIAELGPLPPGVKWEDI